MIKRFAQPVVVLVLALTALVVFSPGASAGTILNQAGQALRLNSVYQDPSVTNGLTASQIDQLDRQIAAGPRPIYIAVLPKTAALQAEVGAANQFASKLQQATGESGIYAGLAIAEGKTPLFNAGASNDQRLSSIPGIATSVYNANTNAGTFAILSAFVTQAESYAAQQNAGGQANQPSQPTVAAAASGPVDLTWLWIVLGVIVIGALVTLAMILRSRKRAFNNRRSELLDAYNRSNYTLTNDFNIADSNYEEASNLASQIKTRIDHATTLDGLSGVYDQIDDLNSMLSNMADARNPQPYPNLAPAVSATSGRSHRRRQASRSDQAEPRATRPRAGSSSSVRNRYTDNSSWNGTPWVGYYPGSGYGYYPGLGWGYYDPNNAFVAGMLAGQIASDERHDWNNQYGSHTGSSPSQPADSDYGSSASSPSVSSSGGGGGWESSSSTSSSSSSSDYGSSSSSSYDSGSSSSSSYDSGSSSSVSDSGGGGSWG